MNREQTMQDVKMYMANDWNLVEETPEYFLLKRNEAKTSVHLLLFLFTWWTCGITNVLYQFAKNKTKKIMK